MADLQSVLDVLGWVPGLGEIADGVNGVLSLGRGNFLGAGLSLVAMIPVVGDALGKGGKLARNAIEHSDEIVDTARTLSRVEDTVAPGLKVADDVLADGSRALDPPGTPRVGSRLDDAAGNVVDDAFVVGRHGSMPAPRPAGMESHHGVNSVWMEANVPGYSANNAPAILMKADPSHNATRSIFNTWRADIAAQQGVSPLKIDWTKVSPGQAWGLAERQFQAAGVTNTARQQYWNMFNQYLDSLGGLR